MVNVTLCEKAILAFFFGSHKTLFCDFLNCNEKARLAFTLGTTRHLWLFKLQCWTSKCFKSLDCRTHGLACQILKTQDLDIQDLGCQILENLSCQILRVRDLKTRDLACQLCWNSQSGRPDIENSKFGYSRFGLSNI